MLYLALEDNPRRLQGRLRKVLAGEKPPHDLVLTDRWPRLGEGGLEAIEAWLISHPDARLVIVDTLEKIRPKGAGRNVYREDYEAVEPLLSLDARYNVAVLVVHSAQGLGRRPPGRGLWLPRPHRRRRRGTRPQEGAWQGRRLPLRHRTGHRARARGRL